ncbi:hypothetical protein GCM10009745_44580 [Kribbella yunnanensis]|uniref:Uncharacterized protein n=1 Tax=Kribbella yunnanensis TaxID=190194 RepID=A0ABN2HV62_9ACTN
MQTDPEDERVLGEDRVVQRVVDDDAADRRVRVAGYELEQGRAQIIEYTAEAGPGSLGHSAIVHPDSFRTVLC